MSRLRLSPAQYLHARMRGQCRAEVIHEFLDAAGGPLRRPPVLEKIMAESRKSEAKGPKAKSTKCNVVVTALATFAALIISTDVENHRRNPVPRSVIPRLASSGSFW